MLNIRKGRDHDLLTLYRESYKKDELYFTQWQIVNTCNIRWLYK